MLVWRDRSWGFYLFQLESWMELEWVLWRPDDCLSFPECVSTLALLWKCMKLSIQVNLQDLKTKMADDGEVVTEQGWRSGLVWYQVCKMFESSKHKTHEPNGCWMCICRNCMFGQFLGVFQLKRVSGRCQVSYVLYIVFILV